MVRSKAKAKVTKVTEVKVKAKVVRAREIKTATPELAKCFDKRAPETFQSIYSPPRSPPRIRPPRIGRARATPYPVSDTSLRVLA